MDEYHFEMAAAMEQGARDFAIKKARAAANPVKPVGFNGECPCGTEIPVLRVAAGYYNCVDCALERETRERQQP